MNIAGCSRENMPKMTSPIPRMRLNTPSFPGQDLVNKFIAATPSYMYSPIAGQHTFYFSELLRSLSQAKKAELINLSREAAVQQQQQQQQQQTQSQPPPHLQVNRKVGRKRGWSQLRNEGIEIGNSDRPLELTSKNSAFMPRSDTSPIKKSESPVSTTSSDPPTTKHIRFNADENKRESKSTSPVVEVTDSHSPPPPINASTNATSDMVLPPVPPAWYPSLYPPYGIDPANFFVDLRVSGHIFERKRELAAQALKTVAGINNNNLPSYFDNDFAKARAGSAFSIPKSREMKNVTGFSGNVMNLSSSENRTSPHTDNSSEHGSDGKDSKHASYMMHVDGEGKSKKVFDNGITVYNVDDSDDNMSGCKKQEESNSDSEDDENIRVDIN